jgi:hypothetical protein
VCDPTKSLEDRVTDIVKRVPDDELAGLYSDVSNGVPTLGIPFYNWWSEALHGVSRCPYQKLLPKNELAKGSCCAKFNGKDKVCGGVQIPLLLLRGRAYPRTHTHTHTLTHSLRLTHSHSLTHSCPLPPSFSPSTPLLRIPAVLSIIKPPPTVSLLIPVASRCSAALTFPRNAPQ